MIKKCLFHGSDFSKDSVNNACMTANDFAQDDLPGYA